MNKPVDNRGEIRITPSFLWNRMWIAETPEMVPCRPLRGARGCSRNIPPLETGTARGRPRERGRSRETGLLHGYLAPAAARGPGKARQLASRCGEAGQGPSISYMEGPCLILSSRNRVAPVRQAGNRRNGSGDDPGTEYGRGPRLAAEPHWLRSRRVSYPIVAAVTRAGR